MVFAMFGICASATETNIWYPRDEEGNVLTNLTNAELISKVQAIADKENFNENEFLIEKCLNTVVLYRSEIDL